MAAIAMDITIRGNNMAHFIDADYNTMHRQYSGPSLIQTVWDQGLFGLAKCSDYGNNNNYILNGQPYDFLLNTPKLR